MTEPVSRQKSSRIQMRLSEITLIVRPPGKPADIRVFTDAERAEAELYATDTGATVELLA